MGKFGVGQAARGRPSRCSMPVKRESTNMGVKPKLVNTESRKATTIVTTQRRQIIVRLTFTVCRAVIRRRAAILYVYYSA